MADSIEQKLINAIVARMALLDGTGDYDTTIATAADGNVNIADSRPNWDEEDLPAMSVFQGQTESAESNDNRRKTIHIVPMMIKVFLKRGTDAANARKAIADVKRAVRSGNTLKNGYLGERWPEVEGTPPGLAMMTREKAHLIEYAENTYEIVGVQVEVEVVWISDKFNAEE